ncbi:FimV/HubP family polar landmark protein [Ampullimonas aquatilis]|uniref:FimV/HubP family polar landmark protein n=1 Tax=Ampullimonas aquatilis TaxID=1341549 RepID=UPI003C747B81
MFTHSEIPNKKLKRTVRLVQVALSGLFLSGVVSSQVQAAGLGRLNVYSALGQPLRAEIELTSVSKDEALSLTAKLAPVEAYRSANIEYSGSLSTLRFAVDKDASGKPVVKVTSSRPLNEPFVDVLVELNWSSGKLVREFTFLLDPPESKAGAQVGEVVVDNRVSGNDLPYTEDRPKKVRRPVVVRAAKSVDTPPAEPTAIQDGKQYRVKPGDTLSGIAKQFQESTLSLDKTMAVLYQSNPNAFINGNMNLIRSGANLALPASVGSPNAVADSGEGRKSVSASSSDFGAYKEQLANNVAKQKAVPTTAKQGSSGKIEAKVQEPGVDPNNSGDKLKLVKPGEGVAGAAAGGVDKKESAAVSEANKRIVELEKSINDLKTQLELRNAALAKSQQAAQTPPVAAVVPPPAKVEMPVVTQPAPVEAVKKAPEKPVEKPTVELTPPVAEKAPVSEPVAEPVKEEPKVEVKPEVAEPAKEEPVAAAPAPVAENTPVVPIAEEPSMVDGLLSNPLALGGVGALIAGALGFAWLQRKKRAAEPAMGDSLLAVSSIGGHSLFGKTGGQSVDTSNVTVSGQTSVFSSSFNPSASQLDANEVDPIAEADVYIAYGRDLQAEEILKEALRNQPDRHSVRVKLLEIYAARRDARSFEMVAGELYAATKGEGDEWARAVALGAGIDPENPLYSGGQVSADVAAKIESLTAPTEPLELNTGTDDLLTAYNESMSISPRSAFAPPKSEPVAELVEDTPPLDSDTVDFDLDLAEPPKDGQEEEISLEFKPSAPAPWENSVIQFNEPSMLDELKSASKEEAADHSISFESTDLGLTNLNEDEPSLDLERDFQPSRLGSMDESPEIPSLQMPVDLSKISLDLNPATEAKSLDYTPSAFVSDKPETSLDLPTIIGGEHDDLAAGMSVMGNQESNFMKTQKMQGRTDVLTADSRLDKPRPLTDVQEMNTKLELAEAYSEMGEAEGARELLEEVLASGSQNQADKAQALLAKLG